MKQVTILAFIPNILQEHRFKQLPFCTGCGRRFTEEEFLTLERNGYNIVWNIDYAFCADCGGEVQGWRR
jgi:rRNA maturation endonuclease Nob1